MVIVILLVIFVERNKKFSGSKKTPVVTSSRRRRGGRAAADSDFGVVGVRHIKDGGPFTNRQVGLEPRTTAFNLIHSVSITSTCVNTAQCNLK